MSRIIIIEGKRRGSRGYVGGDFIYLKTVEKEETTYLKSQVKTCRATAVVRNDSLTVKRAHNHQQPILEEIEDMMRLASVKGEAEGTLDGSSCSATYVLNC